MKIVMLRPSYKPEISAGNHLAADLIQDMILRGYDVELIVPVSSKYNIDKSENKDECLIHRVSSGIKGNGVFKRIFRYIDTSIKMYLKLMKIEDIDIIISHSMPPTLGPLCALAAKLKKKPLLYWEQDIVSQSIISTGIAKVALQKKMFYWIAHILERISEKYSTHIITISEKFKKRHIEHGIDEKKIDVIYNWIDIEQIYPLRREENTIFDEFKLDRSKFYVTYCGNLGVPQNVEIMIDAAEMLKDIEDIKFVIIGGGSRENKVLNYIQEKNLNNLSFFPLQPLERACEIYSLGDVGLVIAKGGTSNNGFPSKTWSIMSAGQAIISCFDLDSELSKFVQNGKCGKAIIPDSAERLKDAILEIYESSDRGKSFGQNARNYVVNNFSRKSATKKFIQIIEEILEIPN